MHHHVENTSVCTVYKHVHSIAVATTLLLSLLLYIEYTSNHWFTSEVSPDQYQERLQKRRRDWVTSQEEHLREKVREVNDEEVHKNYNNRRN